MTQEILALFLKFLVVLDMQELEHGFKGNYNYCHNKTAPKKSSILCEQGEIYS